MTRKLRPVNPGAMALPAVQAAPLSKAQPSALPASLEQNRPGDRQEEDRGRRRERRRRSDEDDHRSDSRTRRRRMARPVSPPREAPPDKPRKTPKKKANEAALDKMLEDEPGDLDSDKLEKTADVKLMSLREQLNAKKAEKASKGPGAILASRAAALADGPQKKKKAVDIAAQALKKAFRGKKTVKEEADYGDASSSGQSDSEETQDDDEELGGSLVPKGSAASKQKKLRQYSEKHPGRLMTAGFKTMHDQVGTHYGSVSSKHQSLSPVMVRYLLSFALPQFQGGISQDKYRELRTIATAVDLMVEGRTTQAGDVLVQRFKSLLMALRDGSDTAAKWLELLPHDVMASMSSAGEDFLARSMAVEEAKSHELLRKASAAS
eukprot:s37_g24.t1